VRGPSVLVRLSVGLVRKGDGRSFASQTGKRGKPSLISDNLSVQQLLECLRELAEASPEDAPAIRARHKHMGADEALFKAANKYSEFWETLGLIKSFEIFWWQDKMAKEVNEIGEAAGSTAPPMSMDAYPWTNQQDLDNIKDKGQDPVLTESQALNLMNRMEENAEEEGLYDE
jgi:hypothetical protein